VGDCEDVMSGEEDYEDGYRNGHIDGRQELYTETEEQIKSLEEQIAELEAELMSLSQDDGKVERALIRSEEENARLRAALEAAPEISHPNKTADYHRWFTTTRAEALR
jgi:septal ring factor EnvC (AmiA/AmiB activator)